MERNAQEQFKAHLMETNAEFRQLAATHCDYAKRLDELEALPHLTDQEQLEEVRLKKLKLRLKDQMEAIVSQYRGSASRLTSGALNFKLFEARLVRPAGLFISGDEKSSARRVGHGHRAHGRAVAPSEFERQHDKLK